MARRAAGATDVEDLRERIAEYRRGRSSRAPLPRELWSEAAGIARRLGVFEAARSLGVSYGALRSRMDGEASGGEPGELEPTFIEVSPGQFFGAPMTTGAVVEVASTDGTRVTVRVGNPREVDWAALLGAAMGRRS